MIFLNVKPIAIQQSSKFPSVDKQIETIERLVRTNQSRTVQNQLACSLEFSLDNHFLSRSTRSRTSTSIRSTTTTSTVSSLSDELLIDDVTYNPNGMLTITWDHLQGRLQTKYYHLQIYDERYSNVLLQRLIDGEQRSIEIDVKDYIKDFTSTYIVCLSSRQKKSCQTIPLQTSKSTSMILSSTKDDESSNSFQFVYLLSGICLGALLVTFVLVVVCCWRLRYLSRVKQLKSLEKLPTNNNSPTSPFYPSTAHSSIFYRPLNIISYPQQQQQQPLQQTASCDTSECSIHSSTDTSQLASDSYHIYQQIPSVYNCHLHPTRTHILV